MVDDFFFEKVFPVVVSVTGKVILRTPLFNDQTVGILISESGSLFLKMGYILASRNHDSGNMENAIDWHD